MHGKKRPLNGTKGQRTEARRQKKEAGRACYL
jgi:hypothetical protein